MLPINKHPSEITFTTYGFGTSTKPASPPLTSEPDELDQTLIDEVLGEVDHSERHHEGRQKLEQGELLLTREWLRSRAEV